MATERPRFITLTAPGGYGKSILARQFSEGFANVVVFDCAGASDSVSLARGLTAALGKLFDASFAQLRLAYSATRESADALGALLLDAWSYDGLGPSLVIFENAEALCANDVDRTIFTRLLGATRPTRTVLFCTRTALPFAMHRFAPPHQTLTLNERDLALNEDETRELLAGSVDDPERVREIQTLTRGWLIATLLVRRIASEGKLAQTMTRLEQGLFDDLFAYLRSEVVSTLDSRAFELLLLLGALPNPTLSDFEVIETSQSRTIRSTLRDLPLVYVDEAAIDVHPLLLAALREDHAHAMKGALRVAAGRMLAAGNHVRAAQFFAHGNDLESAAAALAQTPPYVFSNALPACADVVERLDENMICRYPALWVSTAQLRCFTVDTKRFLSEAKQIWFSLDRAVDPELRTAVLIELCTALAADGRLEACDELVKAEVTRLGEGAPNLRGALLFHLAGRYGVRGAFGKARRFIEAAGHVSELTYLRGRTLDKVEAHEAFLSGHYEAGRALLEQSLRFARHFGASLAVNSTLANAAFFCWLYGDDASYRAYMAELERSLLPGLERAFAEFVAASHNRWHDDRTPAVLEAYRACAALIACTTGTRERRQQAAKAAIASAFAIQDSLLLTLGYLSEILIDGEHDAARLQELADTVARVESEPFARAVAGILEGGDAGFLTAFASRLRDPQAAPVVSLEINVLSGSARVSGKPVKLTDLEMTLVAILGAERRAFRRDELIDAIWPETELENSRNNLKVCIHRIRQKLGEDAVLLDEAGYRMTSAATIDLIEIEAASRNVRVRRFDEAERAQLARYVRALSEARVYARAPEWSAIQERRAQHLHREMSLRLGTHALEAGSAADALDVIGALLARDACDEEACEIAVRAHLSAGNRAAALAQIKNYTHVIRRELGIEPSRTLLALLEERAAS